jgi:hypothetical protein
MATTSATVSAPRKRVRFTLPVSPSSASLPRQQEDDDDDDEVADAAPKHSKAWFEEHGHAQLGTLNAHALIHWERRLCTEMEQMMRTRVDNASFLGCIDSVKAERARRTRLDDA